MKRKGKKKKKKTDLIVNIKIQNLILTTHFLRKENTKKKGLLFFWVSI